MTPRMRAQAIEEVARRGDGALTKSFAYDMILNALSAQRQRHAEAAAKACANACGEHPSVPAANEHEVCLVAKAIIAATVGPHE